LRYSLYMFEYGTLKPVSHFKKVSGRRGTMMEGMNQTRVQYVYMKMSQ
jgi:hypothetical protein